MPSKSLKEKWIFFVHFEFLSESFEVKMATVTTSSTEMNEPTNKIFNVYCRFRPLNARERLLGKDDQTLTENASPLVQIESPRCLSFNGRPYLFDGIYGEQCCQKYFFSQTIEQHLNRFMQESHDLTILTYGQTSSGKTWTIDGSFYDVNGMDSSINQEDNQGLLPRILKRLFGNDNEDNQHGKQHKMAFYEIYCEKIIDLLAPVVSSSCEKKEIKLFEDKNNERMELRGLTWLLLTDNKNGYQRIKTRLLEARMHRHFASTEMNSHSSRAHAILDICVSTPATPCHDKEEKYLRIIDLAGSERIAKTQSSGQVMREGIKINESLMYLKRLIDLLSEKKIGNADKDKNTAALDYRSTKLTRILFSSFRAGRSRVILILCCSPSRDNINETINTLEFGSNARRIRTQLRQMQKRNCERKKNADLDEMAKQNVSTRLELDEKNQLIASYRGKIDEYESSISALNRELKLALVRIQRQVEIKEQGAPPLNQQSINEAHIPPQGDLINADMRCEPMKELKIAKEEKEKVEREKEELLRRLNLVEKAYNRCRETLKMQDDIIQRNTQDIMEMQNEINFFNKFRKYLIETLGDDE